MELDFSDCSHTFAIEGCSAADRFWLETHSCGAATEMEGGLMVQRICNLEVTIDLPCKGFARHKRNGGHSNGASYEKSAH